MRWLVTGAGGMSGSDAVDLLERRGHDVRGVSRADLDVTDVDAARATTAGHDVVLDCAAWTEVDNAEDHEGEASLTDAVGPAALAAATCSTGALLVTVSTVTSSTAPPHGPIGRTIRRDQCRPTGVPRPRGSRRCEPGPRTT